jgi:energy-converting hydrogenase Eha subunit F
MDASRYPDKEYQLEWIRIYLEEWNKHNKITSPVTENDVYQGEWLFSPPSDIGDISLFCLSCLDPLILLLPNSFKLLGFLIFRSLAYLVNVIP